MKFLIVSSLFLTFISAAVLCEGKDRKAVSDHLQNISVTIRAEGDYQKSEGSGVLITRKIGEKQVTFVWTAAHVIDHLRTVREAIIDGSTKKIVEFGDVQIVKELVEDGRRVGEIKMDASVVKYSGYEEGEDLALLMVRAKDYGRDSAKFHLNEDSPIIPIGTQLFHVGSLLGQMGANSMTSGIIAQVGRIDGKVEFDQTTVTAFPGSSGGGVFLTDGTYVGMLVRGAGQGFNLVVPIRRMKKWASRNKIGWALNPKEKMPSLKDIRALPVEDSVGSSTSEKSSSPSSVGLPFLIKVTPLSPKFTPFK